jgi:DNA-binding IclR family transcriptional regulator
MIHKTYLLILEQLEKGNKTSTSIARELNMAQSGIYERLILLEEMGFVKRNEKNFILALKGSVCKCDKCKGYGVLIKNE